MELSRRVANKQVVAPMRQAWINDLRHRIADISASALLRWNQGDITDPDDLALGRLYRLQEEITLLINPTEDDHGRLVDAVRALLNALERGVAGNAAEQFSTARKEVVDLSQKILKTEWNRINNDIEKP